MNQHNTQQHKSVNRKPVQMEPEISSPFCTIAEAARRSGLSAFFIRKQVREGVVPIVRCGRIYRLNYAAFMETMDAISRAQ